MPTSMLERRVERGVERRVERRVEQEGGAGGWSRRPWWPPRAVHSRGWVFLKEERLLDPADEGCHQTQVD